MWLLALLILIDLLILSQTGKRRLDVTVSASVSNGEQWTIYGTMGCGWTRKQLEYMKRLISHSSLLTVKKKVVQAWKPSQLLLAPMGKRSWVTVRFKHG